MASPLLENLNPEQLAAVTLPHASALILAGAGSGKTRVLTTRIAWLLATGQAGPLSILAVTFTNKAAKEMLMRLSALTPVNTRGMWVGTFHGLCNRMLRAHHRDANLPQLFQILDTQDQLSLIKRMYRAHNLDDDRYPPRQLQWFIASAKEEGLRPNMVEAGDELTRRQVEHYALYDAMCQREGVVDFAELLLRSYELLAGHDGLRAHYQRRFSHLLVDEFQDTNTLQYKWLRMLAGPHTAVFAVGDDDQSIYAFRGAKVANMQQFERDFGTPEQPVKLIKLEQNYRSHGHILDAANALIRHNQARLGKNLWTSEGKGEPIRAFAAPTDHDEAAFIVDVVKGIADDDVALDEVALLYRSNAQSRVLEHALFGAGIPYRVYGGMRFFERAEVKHALAYLRLIAAPEDDGAFLRVVNFPPRGIGARTLEQLQDAARAQGATLWQVAAAGALGGKAGNALAAFVQLIGKLADATTNLPLPEAVEHVIEASGLVAHYRAEKDGQDRVDNLAELINAADSFVREAELATDAPMLSERVAPTAAVARSRRRRRRDRSADGVPRARGARSRRDAGRRGPPGAAAHDGPLREGPRVPHGVRHRARGRPLPAREQPVRGRRARGGAAPHVRRDHARAAAPVHHAHAEPHAARTDALQHSVALRERAAVRSRAVAVAVPAPRGRRRRRGVGPRDRRAAGDARGARLADRPERPAREVRAGRHHRRRGPRRRRARAGQLPRRGRQVARAGVREAGSGLNARPGVAARRRS